MTIVRRRRPAAALVALLALCVLPGPACGRKHVERVNLILISLDTCRADRLSCYGSERPNTPYLDAFAEQAVQFNDCLAQSALTAPSHMSMLTGAYVHRHGLLNNQGSIEPPYTLASLLAASGWRTAAFTGHGSFQAKHGLATGFETFESLRGEEPATHTRDLADVVPSALEWLDHKPAADPFFLLVHGYDPHCPFWPDEPWRSRYAGWYQGPFRDELKDLCHPKRFGEKIQSGEIGREELRYIDAMYDAGVSEADVVLGGFLQELERRGLLETSIVVFTSDHGEVLGNHGWVGHGQVWEEALHVPLLVRFPDARWAGASDAPVQLIDLVPTLLSAMGELSSLELPELPGSQGIDLLPLIRGDVPQLSEERMRLARVGDQPNQVALRFGNRYKAVFTEEPETVANGRLFDLQSDPLEQKDIGQVPDGARRFTTMVRRYLQWRTATADEDRQARGRQGAELTSEEDLQMLRDLGYLGDDPGEGDGASGGG